MPPTSDIVLIGAGFSSQTKIRRLQNRLGSNRQRSFYIGLIQIRPSLRVEVNVEFVKKHYDEIVKRINAGTLLVEYKFDRYVDPDELKTLAFGSDEEKAEYERKIAEANDEKVAVQTEESEQRAAAEDKARIEGIVGMLPIGQPLQRRGAMPGGEETELAALTQTPREQAGVDEDNRNVETEEGGAPGAVPVDNATRLTGSNIISPRLDEGENLAGTHAETYTSPRELADARAVEIQAREDSGQSEEPEVDSERSVAPASGEPRDPADFKPLPEGWKNYTKTELLALAEERGIDISDAPSNRELKKRLENYQAGV